MYTDGYIQLVDKHLRETPISTTPFPNYINTCSTNTPSNTAIRKIENTVVVPGFVAYPYLDDPFDDIDNQDKYLLHSTSELYLNMNLYSANPISAQNFVHTINPYQHCIDYLHKYILDVIIHTFNQYVNYIANLKDNSTNAFDKHYCKHVETSFNLSEYEKFFEDNISCLSQSISSLDSSSGLILSIVRYLGRFTSEVFPSSLHSLPLNYHIICLTFIGIQNGLVLLKRESIYIRELFKIARYSGSSSFGGEHELVVSEYLIKRIKKSLKRIRIVTKEISIGLDLTSKDFKSTTYGCIRRLIEIDRKTMDLKSYITGIKNILMYFRARINRDGFLSLKTNDLEEPEKYIKGSALIKMAIKNFEMIQHNIDDSFITIKSTDKKLIRLLRDVGMLRMFNSRIERLLDRKVNIISSLVSVENDTKAVKESFVKYKDLLWVFKVSDPICMTSALQIYKKMEDQISKIDLLTRHQIILYSEMLGEYKSNEYYIDSLETRILLIKLRMEKIKSVITDFNVSNKQNIKNLERSYKFILKQFTGSSLSSTIKILKQNNRKIADNDVNGILSDSIKTSTQDKYIPPQNKNHGELVWAMLSDMSMMETENILLKLYECHRNKEKIEEVLNQAKCYCLFHFKFKDEPYYWNKLADYKGESDLGNGSNTRNDKNDRNHVCMCLVMKYNVYPKFIECHSLVFNIIRDLSSCSSRNFDKHSRRYTIDIHKSKLALFLIETVYKIWILIQSRYLAEIVYTYKVFKCLCGFPNDSYYSYFISIMIFACSLLESSDSFVDIQYGVQKIGSLLAEVKNISSDDETTYQRIVYKIYGHLNGCSDSGRGVLPNEIKHHSFKTEEGHYFVTIGIRRRQKKLEFENSSGCVGESSNGCQPCSQLFCTYKVRMLICYRLMGSRHFEISASFPFTDIKKVKGKVKKCKEQHCCVLSSDINDCNQDLKCPKCKTWIPIGTCLNMVYRKFELVMKQLSDIGILCLIQEIEEISEALKITRRVVEVTMEESKRVAKSIRGIRIVDSTNETRNNKLEGANDNHYSYNDAYRINTSRAHGSLKYIIIKIVLILIIVVMTIFIRVKIETDDEYKMDNLLSEENGMCECNSEATEIGVQNNGIKIKYNGTKNNGTRKTSRTKGMKKKSLMIVMSVISGLYLNVVIGDLYVVLSLEYKLFDILSYVLMINQLFSQDLYLINIISKRSLNLYLI